MDEGEKDSALCLATQPPAEMIEALRRENDDLKEQMRGIARQLIAMARPKQVAVVAGAEQVRREPKANEPVPSSPSQAAVLGLVEAVGDLLDLMDMQEQREAELLHLPAHIFEPTWREGKEKARAALSRYRATPGQG